LRTRKSMQSAEIDDVFPCRKVGINTSAVGQDTDTLAYLQRFADRAHPIDEGVAAVRFENGIKDPQRSRLARTVRPQQSGDPSIGREQAHVANGDDGAELLAQTLGLDHASAPLMAPVR